MNGNNFNREQYCSAQERASFLPFGNYPAGLISRGSIRWKCLVGSLRLKAPRTNYIFFWKYILVLRVLLSRETILTRSQPAWIIEPLPYHALCLHHDLPPERSYENTHSSGIPSCSSLFNQTRLRRKTKKIASA